jgi:hypothetical protein
LEKNVLYQPGTVPEQKHKLSTMKHEEIPDPIFRDAVDAIDTGNIALLEQLLEADPQLISQRLPVPDEGYFKQPYLMWFVADNPIRNEKLPENIVDITKLLIRYGRNYAKDSYTEQINYTLGLVETGRIPRESGSQIELMELLLSEGASPGDGHGALIHGNIEAAKYIISKTGKHTLTTAVCLDLTDIVLQLLNKATKEDKQVALIAAAFYGKSGIIQLLLQSGVDVNAYIKEGFHTHATALHQAVFSGSIESVKLLVDAGADINLEDKIYHASSLDWAIHMQSEEADELKRKKYADIEKYLRSKYAE